MAVAAPVAVPVAVAAEPPLAPVVVMERGAGAGDSSEAEGELFGAEVSPAKAVAELAACRVTTGTTSTRRRRRSSEGVYSEELSGSEAAEDEWWAQGGGGPRRWLLRRRLRRATPRRSRGAGGPVAEG